jgi:hypothetical protein
MSSLESCIKKAGKLLSREDAIEIRKLRNALVEKGTLTRDQANQQAVDNHLESLKAERFELVGDIEKAGGTMPKQDILPSKLAQQDMFGADLTKQGLADLERAKDKARNEGQEEVETGDEGDLFSESGKQLRLSVKDPFEREFVDARPEHPLAQTTKYGTVMQAAAEEKPKGIRRLMNWMKDTDNLGIEGALGAVPQTKLKDFVRYGMDAVGEYTKLIKRMDGFMNGLMEGHADLAKEWLKFNNGNRKIAKILGEFMHASSLAGVDPVEFEMPDAATMKKMNKVARAMWRKRAVDHKILMPFWERLGKEGGDQVTYKRELYNPVTKKMETVGTPIKVSQAQSIYLRVRDVYGNQRTQLIENLEKRINETEADQAAKAALIAKLRLQFERGKIVPYFPLARFGKHWAVAKDTETGEVVGFIKRENRRERNDWMEAMRKQGFAAYPSEEKETDVDAMNKIDPGFVASVTKLIGEKVEGGAEIQDEIWQMYLKTLPEMSARKAYIHREGRLGFTHDALRTFSDHTFHGTHQMGKLRYGHQLSTLLKDAHEEANILLKRAAQIKNMEQTEWRPEGMQGMPIHDVLMATIPEYGQLYSKLKKEANVLDQGYHEESANTAREQIKAEAEHDGPWAVPLANELSRRHAYNMNPKSAAWATNATAFGFLWFLSSSPAAGVLNLTQTAISAYPILRAEFNGMGSGQELLKAANVYASAPWQGLKTSAVETITSKLKNEKDGIGEKAAFEEFDRIGMFTKTRTRELMGLSEAGSNYSQRQQQYLEWAGYIFHKSEEINRVVTGLAAYRLARKKLSSKKDMPLKEQHERAILLAEEMVEMSHYDYTNTNRPRFMQGDKGRVVFLFRNYSLNMQYRLIRDFRDGVWKNDNIPKADRKQARQRFVGIMSMTSLFAGLNGLWMMAAVETIANALLSDDDEPYDSKTALRAYLTDIWGEKAAEAIVKGPWDTLTGTTLSSRASLNNLWIREIPDKLRGKDLLLHLAGEGLGPIFGIGMNFAQGWSDFQQPHTQDRAVERFMPKAVADVLKTLRFATKGAQTYSSDLIMTPEEFTSSRKIAQILGFTPSELTQRYEQNRAIKDMEMKLKDRHDNLMNKLFMAYKLQDRGTAREALKEIQAWNRAQPRLAISPETLLRSAKTRAQYDLRTVGGVAVDKRLQYLHNELRFTPRRGE